MKAVGLLLTMALLAFAPLGQAQLILAPDLEFTSIVTDPADHTDAWDLLDISVAEPGDKTLVFRWTVSGNSVPGANYAVIALFTSGGTAWSPGVNGDGSGYAWTPTDTRTFDKGCDTSSAPVHYCAMSYEALGASVGSVISGTHGYTAYKSAAGGVVADYGPGLGGFYPNIVLAGRGADYTLVGCTKANCATEPEIPADVPETFHQNLTNPAVAITHAFTEATNDTYVYNWATEATDIVMDYNATVGNGSVMFNIIDGNGTGVFDGTITADFNATESFSDLAAGNWTIEMVFAEFTGSFQLLLDAPAEETPTDEEEPGNEEEAPPEQHEEAPAPKKSPGVPALLFLGALAIAVARRR